MSRKNIIIPEQNTDRYIYFEPSNFATMKDKALLNIIKVLIPTFVQFWSSQRPYPISDLTLVKADVPNLQKLFIDLNFLRNDDKIITIKYILESSHSLQYFLITLRLAPFFIVNFHNKVLIELSHIFNTFDKKNKKR